MMPLPRGVDPKEFATKDRFASMKEYHYDPGCNFLWTYDPDVLGDAVGRTSVLYYGSYVGGVFAQRVRLTREGQIPPNSTPSPRNSRFS